MAKTEFRVKQSSSFRAHAHHYAMYTSLMGIKLIFIFCQWHARHPIIIITHLVLTMTLSWHYPYFQRSELKLREELDEICLFYFIIVVRTFNMTSTLITIFKRTTQYH